jgi:hypothetical protein
MHMKTNILKVVQRAHLYLGVFVAPSILSFAFTGALQRFSLHEPAVDGSYRPAKWIVVLAQIHKKQTPQLPPGTPKPSVASHGDFLVAREERVSAAEIADRPAHNALPLKVLFLVASVALFLSILTGLYTSYKYVRHKFFMAGLFLCSIVIPFALMAT